MIKVNDLRLSLIWVEAFPDLLRNPPKLQSRWGALDSDAAYAGAFMGAREKKGQGPLTLPWPEKDDDGHKHFFWFHYLHEEPRKISPGKALRALVPFREPKLARVSAPFPQSRVWLTAYHYPHGLALVANAEIKADLPLADMVQRAFELARDKVLEFTWRGGAVERLKLIELGETALRRVRAETYGAESVPGLRSSTPFSVATFVRGDVESDPPPIVGHGDSIHRALEALCSWSSYWETAELHKFAERRLPTSNAPPSHVLYGLESGRAVWFPEGFAPTEPKEGEGKSGKRKISLGCYHHNLTYASLQTESLARLMELAQQIQMRGETLEGSKKRLVRAAAGILGRTYGGDKKTVYSSFSPAVQLEDNGWIPTLAYVRNQLNIPGALHKDRSKTSLPG